MCPFEILEVLHLAEVGALEEFLEQDDVSALTGSFANERFCPVQVCGKIIAAGHLSDR